jgi:hypothetical protein
MATGRGRRDQEIGQITVRRRGWVPTDWSFAERALLTKRLGQAPVTAELDTADELIRLCRHCPLA